MDKMADRINYRKLELDYLDSADLETIEAKARCLTLEECFDYLFIDPTELTEAEHNYARKAWRRGRMDGIVTATNKLFSCMSTRNGGTIALEYLRSLSDTFHISPDTQSTSSEFSFKVTMPDGTETTSAPVSIPRAVNS